MPIPDKNVRLKGVILEKRNNILKTFTERYFGEDERILCSEPSYSHWNDLRRNQTVSQRKTQKTREQTIKFLTASSRGLLYFLCFLFYVFRSNSSAELTT